MRPRTWYLVLALAVSLVCGADGGCDDSTEHPRSRTVHCKDGSGISGPGVNAGSCSGHGGLG